MHDLLGHLNIKEYPISRSVKRTGSLISLRKNLFGEFIDKKIFLFTLK